MDALGRLKACGFTAVEVPLTRGQWAVIDIEDASAVLTRRWWALKWSKRVPGFYAVAYVGRKLNGNPLAEFLHRFILGARSSHLVDHRDGNGLENRRFNLRVCDHANNRQNGRRLRSDNSCGFKGVYRREEGWSAQIFSRGKHHSLGTFPTAEDAARAYDEAAVTLFGEFAATNRAMGRL
jgi:hypothetical protein